MRFAKGARFKKKGITYEIVSLLWHLKEVVRYEFKTINWDEPVEYYEMSAKEFRAKVSEKDILL
jgi:hypothetical protein